MINALPNSSEQQAQNPRNEQSQQHIFNSSVSQLDQSLEEMKALQTMQDEEYEGLAKKKSEAIKNQSQYVDVTVYTQMKEDCQWGIFDFEAANFNMETKSLTGTLDYQSELQRCYDVNVEMCKFQVKGTNYITRQSKFEMSYISPNESSPNQQAMGSLSVIQNPNSYLIYQNQDLTLDFTKQIKRGDDFISQQLKELSKKSCFVVTNDGITTIPENARSNFVSYQSGRSKKNSKIMKKGAVIRQGDIIKFGRVPVLIKEWSYDTQRWQHQDAVRKDIEADVPSRDQAHAAKDFLMRTPNAASMFQQYEESVSASQNNQETRPQVDESGA